MANSPKKPNWLKACPNIPDSRITQATPKLAPELIPSTEGPASGFLKTVCISKPATESPAPANIAVRACGSLDFMIMFLQTSFSPFPVNRMSNTSLAGIETVPSSRLRNANTAIETSTANISTDVYFFIISQATNRMFLCTPVLLERGGKPLQNLSKPDEVELESSHRTPCLSDCNK